MALQDPGKIDFDGDVWPMPKQGAKWEGFSVRFNDGAGSIETITEPLSEIRDAPLDDGGQVVVTMRTFVDENQRTHFFLMADDTGPIPPKQVLYWDIRVTDPDGDVRRPIGGRVTFVPAVTRRG